MASEGSPGSPESVSPCKKPRLWEPSVIQCKEEGDAGKGSECGTSVDSGLSDTGAISPFERGSTPQEEDVAAAPISMPEIGGGEDSSGDEVPENQGHPGASQEHQERDDLSSLSGFSDMSGQEWKPNMTGKLAWLHKCMARGEDPRLILQDLLPATNSIPMEMDNITLWKLLFNLLGEPPSREKLENINTLDDCVQLIRNSKNVLVLTGAGVSVSCGIPDFRSKDGVYARLAVDFPDLPDPQAMFDIHYFRKDPRPFFKFAREIYPGQFEPSPCHRFIRCLETHSRLLRNYTQNIDTLEQVAGIESVIQCHGSFATATCAVCKNKVDADSIREDVFSQNIPLCQKCPKPDLEQIFNLKEKASKEAEETKDCGEYEMKHNYLEQILKVKEKAAKEVIIENEEKDCEAEKSKDCDEPVPGPSKSPGSGAMSNVYLHGSPFAGVPIMKPDIVFFGEGLSDDFHHAITSDKSECDLLIVIGSSLKVRPVALIPSSLPPEVPQILINREPLPNYVFDCELLGDCDRIINQLCNMLGEGWSTGVTSLPLDQFTGIPPSPEPPYSLDRSGSPLVEEKVETESDLGESSKPRAKEAISDTKDEAEEQWKPKQSLAESIPEGQFLFLSPARYVFPGAEVMLDSSDDEDLDSLPDEEGGGSNDEEKGSDDEEKGSDSFNVNDEEVEMSAVQEEQSDFGHPNLTIDPESAD